MKPFRDLLLQVPAVLSLLASPSVKFAQGVEVVGTSSSTSSLALVNRRQADITPRGLQGEGLFGDYCYDNNECASNICSEADGLCLVASGTGAFGNSCTQNNQCASDICSSSGECLKRRWTHCTEHNQCGTDFCHPANNYCEISPDEKMTMDWDDLVENQFYGLFDFGYTKETWDAYEDIPAFEKSYSDLSAAEKSYALDIGYTEDSWNNKVLRSEAKPRGFGDPCTDNSQCASDSCSSEGLFCRQALGYSCTEHNECVTDFCNPSFNSCAYSPDEFIAMDWDDLEGSYSGQLGILGYTKETWDAYEDISVFEKSFSALTDFEKSYASGLGYTEDSWNNKVLRSEAKPGFEIHSTGNVTATAISGTSIRLIAQYNASDRDHETWVLSSDCITPFDGILEDAFTVETTSAVPLGPAHITFNSTIDVDISKVNTTSIWKALPGGALGGVFGLCIETSIYFELSDGSNEKMNFVNTNLTLTVEMDASFSVTSATSRDAAKQEEVRVDYSDYVTAYECVESDLVNKANDQEYSQGDELKICVKSKDPTIVQVGGIQRLTLSQDDDATDDDFTYINGGNPVSSEIAATTCDKTITPAHVCHADMQLLGRYFEDESPGELTATGSVKLSFPDGSERRLTVDVPIASGIRGGDLALENSARHMEEEKPDDSPFDVTVSLKSSPDGSGGTNDFNGATLLSGMVGAVGGAILMA